MHMSFPNYLPSHWHCREYFSITNNELENQAAGYASKREQRKNHLVQEYVQDTNKVCRYMLRGMGRKGDIWRKRTKWIVGIG